MSNTRTCRLLRRSELPTAFESAPATGYLAGSCQRKKNKNQEQSDQSFEDDDGDRREQNARLARRCTQENSGSSVQ